MKDTGVSTTRAAERVGKGASSIQEMLRARKDRGSDGRSVEPIGHPILGPEGEMLHLPQWAITRLDRLRLVLKKRGTSGLLQISPTVHLFLSADFQTLMGKLRSLLGPNISEPEWVVCNCKRCTRVHEDADRQSDAYWISSRMPAA